eukprot:9005086-Alexandrium_andersonii.AAC.1
MRVRRVPARWLPSGGGVAGEVALAGAGVEGEAGLAWARQRAQFVSCWLEGGVWHQEGRGGRRSQKAQVIQELAASIGADALVKSKLAAGGAQCPSGVAS